MIEAPAHRGLDAARWRAILPLHPITENPITKNYGQLMAIAMAGLPAPLARIHHGGGADQ
jgi:hypothetical protein